MRSKYCGSIPMPLSATENAIVAPVFHVDVDARRLVFS